MVAGDFDLAVLEQIDTESVERGLRHVLADDPGGHLQHPDVPIGSGREEDGGLGGGGADEFPGELVVGERELQPEPVAGGLRLGFAKEFGAKETLVERESGGLVSVSKRKRFVL